MTEAEFMTLAETLRPFTEQRTKIEVAPWIENDVVGMQELYRELTIEKLENKPCGVQEQSVASYKDLFPENANTVEEFTLESTPHSRFLCKCPCRAFERETQNYEEPQTKGVSVLCKADPGMGKTTLAKKITFDWAKQLFTRFTIVFFVLLKLVDPKSTIEQAIIEQNPRLEGLKITESKLRAILTSFGSRCLLVLDGLDEHGSGRNKAVENILMGRNLPSCSVLLTSRPHNVKQLERYFQTVIRIDGFTRREAARFAMQILKDEIKVESVLNFNPTDFREDGHLYQCPILLSFLCILVRDEDIDLSSCCLHIGEIYMRMVQSLYKKYLATAWGTCTSIRLSATR